MTSINYIVEYSWDSFLQKSMLQDPLELFGFLIILVALVFVGFLAIKMSKSYKETKDTETLYWALAYWFLLFAVITLISEVVSYRILGQESLGNICAIVALITSATAIVCFSLFAIQATYPDKIKILGAIVTILAVIYVGALSYSIIIGPPLSDIQDYEIVYNPMIDIIVYCTLMPIIILAPVVFLYFGIKVRPENKPKSTRSIWIGIGQSIFVVGYIAEVAPFFPADLAIPFRTLYIIAAYIMYVCFQMPNWFKNKISWVDES